MTRGLSRSETGRAATAGLRPQPRVKGNRLAGTWYHDAHVDGNGHPDVTGERVATYAYDGLFRRIGKVVANQGEGVVFHSDDNGTGISAGDRTAHYFYSGWRLVETTDHASGDPYNYANSHVLGQFVYGTQYIDEPVCYDRNTDVGVEGDTGCVDAGSQRYFYHQDANYRVVMLTDER